MTASDQSPLLRPSRVAAMLNISERTLSRLIAAGKFPRPILLGRSRRWERASVEQWLSAAVSRPDV
jgi:excisionase family DNA binding protein